jgi:hypothetical protein
MSSRTALIGFVASSASGRYFASSLGALRLLHRPGDVARRRLADHYRRVRLLVHWNKSISYYSIGSGPRNRRNDGNYKCGNKANPLWVIVSSAAIQFRPQESC